VIQKTKVSSVALSGLAIVLFLISFPAFPLDLEWSCKEHARTLSGGEGLETRINKTPIYQRTFTISGMSNNDVIVNTTAFWDLALSRGGLCPGISTCRETFNGWPLFWL